MLLGLCMHAVVAAPHSSLQPPMDSTFVTQTASGELLCIKTPLPLLQKKNSFPTFFCDIKTIQAVRLIQPIWRSLAFSKLSLAFLNYHTTNLAHLKESGEAQQASMVVVARFFYLLVSELWLDAQTIDFTCVKSTCHHPEKCEN